MLDAAAAEAELKKFMDRSDPDYVGDAVDKDDAIDKATNGWGNALYECAKLVFPATTAADAARDSFIAAAAGMEADPTGAVFQAAVDAFAATLGAGMTEYGATPPPTPYNPAVPSGPAQSDTELAAAYMATTLATWFATGTATNISGTINWG